MVYTFRVVTKINVFILMIYLITIFKKINKIFSNFVIKIIKIKKKCVNVAKLYL